MNRSMRRLRRKPNRAAASVEVALILPVIVLVTFGFVEAGYRVDCLHVLHNAARQGARAAIYLENSNPEVEATVVTSLSNAINVDANDITVRISKLDDAGDEEYQVMSLDDNELGDAIRVTVTVDYVKFTPPSSFFFPNTGSLSSSAAMQRKK